MDMGSAIIFTQSYTGLLDRNNEQTLFSHDYKVSTQVPLAVYHWCLSATIHYCIHTAPVARRERVNGGRGQRGRRTRGYSGSLYDGGHAIKKCIQ